MHKTQKTSASFNFIAGVVAVSSVIALSSMVLRPKDKPCTIHDTSNRSECAPALATTVKKISP